MDSKEFRNLQEAYLEVVENQQQLGEGYKPLPTDRIKNKASRLAKDTLRDAGTTLNPFKSAGEKSEAKSNMEKRQKRVDKMVSVLKDKTQKEEVDSFEEGYKVRNAAKIMNKKDSLRASGNLEKLGRAGDIERKLYRRDFSAQIPDAKERLNKTRSDKRSKLVSDNNAKKKSFPNRLRRSDKQGIHDSYDYYDIILSHLLDEGYAETIESAEGIMVNMSEEWRDDIVEELTGERRKRAQEKIRELQPKGRRRKSTDAAVSAIDRVVRSKEGGKDPSKFPTKRGGEGEKGKMKSYSLGGHHDRGAGNKAARRAGTYKEPWSY